MHTRFHTPVINIIIISAFSMLALAVSLETAVKFVSFGALIAFIFVNLCVIAQRYIRDKQRSLPQTIVYLIFPLTGAGFIGWLLSLLDKNALFVGLLWLLFGMAYHYCKKLTHKSATMEASRKIVSGSPLGMSKINNVES
ncbi:hypothetical protein [Paenibacillus piri]|uniref:Amino acid permease n=1 Tax=Paenibacillus piri TaxID=2547395 RepID=A0A4R5KBM8_9BACL|nr:hypothetical protein [Paenibacillus piri]TDF92613.1 hypothetical protein E1757_29980 [Paenibacillus piri]